MLCVTSQPKLFIPIKGACSRGNVNRVRVLFSIVPIKPRRYVQDGGSSRVSIITVVGLLDVSGNMEARENDVL